MRLIDADEAKRFVEENPNNLFIKGFFGVIDEIPTAYDLENVILELNKQCFPNEFGDFVLNADEVIEKVKSGGVSDD